MNSVSGNAFQPKLNWILAPERSSVLGIIFPGFAALGLLCLTANIAGAAGQVICAVLKYVFLPFGLLLSICYIAKYGL